MNDPWVIAGYRPGLRSGGDLRARHIFSALQAHTDARAVQGLNARALLAHRLSPRRPLSPVNIAAVDLLTPRAARLPRWAARPRVLDLHDDPVVHSDALGLPLRAGERRDFERRMTTNVAQFDQIVVQTGSFADLCGIPEAKRIVVANGTDTREIHAEPWPNGSPIVAMISGAAPGRGIELLVEAVGHVRSEGSDVRLELGLAATSERSKLYLTALERSVRRLGWVGIREVAYADLSAFLAHAWVLVLPHPPHPYYDAILPVKLFDSMAAGRPVVVTPRVETARLVEETSCGVVTGGDMPEDLARSIRGLLASPERAHRLGESGRQTVVARFDWMQLARHVADAVLRGG